MNTIGAVPAVVAAAISPLQVIKFSENPKPVFTVIVPPFNQLSGADGKGTLSGFLSHLIQL